jgi:hypothetical protein
MLAVGMAKGSETKGRIRRRVRVRRRRVVAR